MSSPREKGYSILILPYPTRAFRSLPPSLPASLPRCLPSPRPGIMVRPFHSFASQLGAFVVHNTNPTTVAESLHCDFSRDTSAPSRDPSSALCGKTLDAAFPRDLTRATSACGFRAHGSRETGDGIPLAFWLLASSSLTMDLPRRVAATVRRNEILSL